MAAIYHQDTSDQIFILSGGDEVLNLADLSNHRENTLKRFSPARSRSYLKKHLEFVPRPDEYKSISPLRPIEAKIGEGPLKLSYYYDEYNPRDISTKSGLFSRKTSGGTKAIKEPKIPSNYKPSTKQILSQIKMMVDTVSPSFKKMESNTAQTEEKESALNIPKKNLKSSKTAAKP